MTETHETGKRDSGKTATRKALLEAGVGLLLENPASSTLDHIRATAVAARAKVTHGAFYGHFESQEAFRTALLDYILSDGRHEDEYQRTMEALAEADGTLMDIVRRGGAANLDFVSQRDLAWKVSIGLWAQRKPEYDQRLRQQYAAVTQTYGALYSSLLGAFGREPRPPLTMNHIAVVFTALVEGLAIRQNTDPDSLPTLSEDLPGERSRDWDLFGIALAALLPAVTRPVGSSETLFEFVQEALAGAARETAAETAGG